MASKKNRTPPPELCAVRAELAATQLRVRELAAKVYDLELSLILSSLVIVIVAAVVYREMLA